MQEILRLRLAFAFLTLLPVAPKEHATAKDFGRSLKYFSLVGLLFGLVNLAIIYLGLSYNKAELIPIALILASLLLTGGLHLDGFADCFDGIAASKKTREETIEVLRDSRVGAFGSFATCALLLTKYAALSSLDFAGDPFRATGLSFLFFIMPIMSRTIMTLALLFQVNSDNARSSCSSLHLYKDYEKKFLDTTCNILSLKIPALIFLLLYKFPFSWNELLFYDMIFITWLVLAWLAYLWLKKKLMGHNGDSMGGGLELNETIFCVLTALFI